MIMAEATLAGYRCERCGDEWRPRKSDEVPKVCPKCKSAYWKSPRKDAAEAPARTAYDKEARTEKKRVAIVPDEPTPAKETSDKTLPYNPIDTAMRTPEHARRTIRGILESYNGNYDALAEAIQNAMDALEDAAIHELPGPYVLDITIDLKDNAITVFDTGIGMTQDQVCEAFAPSATFKEDSTIVKKRGDKYPYRGYKGVGMTFLAYGTDDIRIQSRQNGTLIRGRMRFGRQWVEGKQADPPMLEIDSEPTPLDTHKRETCVRVQFGSETRPSSLSQLGSGIDIWEAIVRTRTAAGEILLGMESAVPIKVHLKVVDRDGLKAENSIGAVFYYPHLVKRNPEFRFLDIGKYHKDHPGLVDHPAEALRQDAVYMEWDTTEIISAIGKEKVKDLDAELAAFTPRLYAFRPYQAPVWSDINKCATQQVKTHYFGPGLVIGLTRQRLAENFPVKASRSELLAQNIFVLVHFDKARPDQGRKTLQSRVMELAQAAADAAIQFLLTQTGLLKPAGEKTTAAQREVERNHEDWVDNVKGHQRANPLLIPPVSYTSIPITEQDVVGLFHQFTALGVFPGLKVLATSGQHTYDCYGQFECKEGIDRLRYNAIDDNPLGLSSDVLAPGDKDFLTRGLTIEFKNNLEGLTAEIDDLARRKAFRHIDIAVCWSYIEGKQRSYTLEPITEANLHERRYPGVTHVLRKDNEGHVIQVVLLEEIVKRIRAGQIRLRNPK